MNESKLKGTKAHMGHSGRAVEGVQVNQRHTSASKPLDHCLACIDLCKLVKG